MKKDLAKTICICKGCKELLEFEYGPSMGFNPDIQVKIVDNTDNIPADNILNFEDYVKAHKE